MPRGRLLPGDWQDWQSNLAGFCFAVDAGGRVAFGRLGGNVASCCQRELLKTSKLPSFQRRLESTPQQDTWVPAFAGRLTWVPAFAGRSTWVPAFAGTGLD